MVVAAPRHRELAGKKEEWCMTSVVTLEEAISCSLDSNEEQITISMIELPITFQSILIIIRLK